MNLKGRSLLTLKDFSPDEIRYLLDTAVLLKKEKKSGTVNHRLEGKNIALIFEKNSTRTRCAFVVAANDEGAHAEYLGKNDIQLGKKESVKDTARVLGRMFDAIEFRGYKQETVEALAKYSGIPVWNGLTDLFHPTQVLADLLTIEEHFGHLEGISLAYCGDGRNNMANSLMIGCAKMGMNCRIVSPACLKPDPSIINETMKICKNSEGNVIFTENLTEGVRGADVIYTDVWTSMGEESKFQERIKLLMPYQVNASLMRSTGKRTTVFMHCLPAFHDNETEVSSSTGALEVTDEVFESKASIVFDQAENRLHTIKAVMTATLSDKPL